MRSHRLLWTLVLLLGVVAVTTSAFEQAEPGALYARQKATTSPTTKGTTSPTPTPEDGGDTSTGTGKTSTAPTGKATGSDSADTGTGTGTSATRTKTRTTRIGANAPVGSIQMKTPSIMDPMSYYPIAGDPITWVYNYTSLIVTPTAINIEAYCGKTQWYYTIRSNYSVAETQVVWDTAEYESTGNPPLAMETYTLIMYDSGSDKTAVPTAGHLAVFNSLQFAMYNKRPYVDKDKYKCQTCSAASSLLSDHGVRVLLGSALVAALSFTWFIHGIL